MNEFRKRFIEPLVELKLEISHLNPVGYSDREFSQESNNIQQAQANTIVKLLVKINNRLEDLDNRLNRLENNFQTFRKNKESISNLKLNNCLDNIDKELDILINRVEKLNLNRLILTRRTIDIKDILRPKLILKSKITVQITQTVYVQLIS